MNQATRLRPPHTPPHLLIFDRWRICAAVQEEHLPMVAMWDGDRLWFGRYSAVNHTWQGWDGHTWIVVWPSHYIDLSQDEIG